MNGQYGSVEAQWIAMGFTPIHRPADGWGAMARTEYSCNTCGALVNNGRKHVEWHATLGG